MDSDFAQSKAPRRKRRKLPRSFKELTPTQAFSPRAYFRQMVWKALLTPRGGQRKTPAFPRLGEKQVAITFIGHASFLIQFADLNVLIDPNFANWLFFMKRQKHAGLKLKDLPQADLVLLTHAHFDHFHKRTLRRLSSPRMAIVPWGVSDLADGLGFDRVLELEWWETFSRGDLRVTLTPCKHWGARVLRDHHRGYGGFLLEYQGRRIYHAGDSAYFDGFKEIGTRCTPEIALLPIGAYEPESFRSVHMGPEDAVKAFRELQAQWIVPMHYGTFRLSFEDMDEPLRRLRGLIEKADLGRHLRVLEEGVPEVF